LLPALKDHTNGPFDNLHLTFCLPVLSCSSPTPDKAQPHTPAQGEIIPPQFEEAE